MFVTKRFRFASPIVVALALAGPALVAAQDRPEQRSTTDRAPSHPSGWAADPRTGCMIWAEGDATGYVVSWSGGCGADGRAAGSGTAEWNLRGSTARYVGGMRGGLRNGHGTISNTNGDSHDGEWRDGLRSGNGINRWANGDRYEGGFFNNRLHGIGIYVWVDGERYEGEYSGDRRHGRGRYFWLDGGRYEGGYQNGERHGRGLRTWPNGDRYDGEWRNGQFTGRGVMTWADGRRYRGEWRDGRPDGRGEATIGGIVYSGVWIHGCFREGTRSIAIARPLEECP